jgi:glutamate N-acetyltransferase/amino-acid N-acetyltransferase
MSGSISPLVPKTYADMPPVRGVRMATAAAGIKYRNRTDVLMMVFDRPAAVAGVFTRSKCPSAPVDFCRANLPGGVARAVWSIPAMPMPSPAAGAANRRG